jgi:hypothetical protein
MGHNAEEIRLPPRGTLKFVTYVTGGLKVFRGVKQLTQAPAGGG